MLARTGLKAALAAEIVSLWICSRVPFFDFRSATIGIGAPEVAPFGESTGGGAVADGDGGGLDEDPSDVIRSMSVVPDES